MQTSIVLTDHLSFLDYSIIIGSLLATMAAARIGKRLYKHDSTAAGYILMGRRLTLPLFVATLVATWYGGIFGVTEIAFNQGIFNFFTQGVFWYATYLIFAFFLVERIRADSSVTLPDLVRSKLGAQAGYIASLFNFFNILPVAYVLSLGIFIRVLTGFDLPVSILIGVGFVAVYVGVGGLASVVFPDAVQFIFMYTAVASVIFFSVQTYGGLDFLTDTLPARYFHPSGGESLLSMFVWGFIALGTLVDPSFYQRCLAANHTKTARNGILISTVIWFTFDICTTMGGMYAAAVIPTAKASEAYMTYAMQVLPNGWRGLLVAGVLATILSTIDSFCFIATNTIFYDFLRKQNFHASIRNVASIASILLLTAVIAMQFDGSIKRIWKLFGSYSAGCLLVPLMLKLFAPRLVQPRDFVVATIAACLTISGWYLIPRYGIWADVDAIYPGLIVSALSIIVCELKRT